MAAILVWCLLAAPEALSPEEEFRRLRIAGPFRVELVAAEPLVVDPVSVAWDEKGRLWVVEMSDYPLEPGGGRVRRLEDRDGDGRPEHAVVFAEGLPHPTSVLPHRRGALVAAAPDILYLEDTDGDARADVRRVVLTGFAEGNTQLRVNTLIRGMDGFIYGANGRSGGKPRRPDDPPESAVDIGQRDFRFRPDTWQVEAIAGPSQYTHAFDDWGRRYLSWNTIHLRQEMLSPRDLERHPRLLRTATLAHSSDHGDDARVYPLAPPPRTFNNEPVDHFNAGCGLTIERGGIFPKPYAGCAYSCEPLLGLVHRDVLEPGPGAAVVAKRGEVEREFLAASDPWFHPVFLRNGPDGALYVVDFYRELVEHPHYVPAEIRGKIDFIQGRGHGRLWRIVPEGKNRLAVEDLSALSAPELVGRLPSASGAVRDEAHRLLDEKRDAAAAEPLRALARDERQPPARVHALWLLSLLGQLDRASLEEACSPQAPARLREAAARIARSSPHVPSLTARLIELLRDGDPGVRLQAALAMGDVRGPAESIVRSLAAALRSPGGSDTWFEAAVLSSLSGREVALVEELAAKDERSSERPGSEPRAEFLREVAELAAAGGDAPEARAVLETASSSLEHGRVSTALALADGLGRGLRRAGAAPARIDEMLGERWSRLCERAASLADNSAGEPADRRVAASVLGYARWDLAGPVLARLLGPREAPEIAQTAARALGRHDDEASAAALLAAWPAAAPSLRGILFEALTSRPARRAAFLAAIEDGRVAAGDVNPARRQALERALDPESRKRLDEQLGKAASSRGAVVEKYVKEAPASGDPARGVEIYRKNCAQCHRFAGQGHLVGPDLSGLGRKPREELLVAMLDPNRSIAEGYGAYSVTLKTGEVLNGIIASETATALTLRRAEGVEDTIPRASIRAIAAAASLMPDGIETTLSLEDAAHLLAYLRGEGTR